MCGRYSLSVDQDIQEINRIIAEVNSLYPETAMKMKTGEIFPTNLVPILMNDRDDITPALQVWGFPSFRDKGVVDVYKRQA